MKEALELFKDDFGLRKMEILKEIEDPNIKVFFNIGRFDQQKGHDRLIQAFEKYMRKIIIQDCIYFLLMVLSKKRL